jgi:hypothetical protein
VLGDTDRASLRDGLDRSGQLRKPSSATAQCRAGFTRGRQTRLAYYSVIELKPLSSNGRLIKQEDDAAHVARPGASHRRGRARVRCDRVRGLLSTDFGSWVRAWPLSPNDVC